LLHTFSVNRSGNCQVIVPIEDRFETFKAPVVAPGTYRYLKQMYDNIGYVLKKLEDMELAQRPQFITQEGMRGFLTAFGGARASWRSRTQSKTIAARKAPTL
jgi:hypothetical protein